MTQRYELGDDCFILRGYGTLAPFTSFLPGLAGVKGIPIWSFYVNRGQGICSFGIDHKSNAILEFDPAYLAYEKVPINGCQSLDRPRSFIRGGLAGVLSWEQRFWALLLREGKLKKLSIELV
ncbi:hypothetical protein ACX93W_07545 [Paenibacillus sp. CAU 1782]